METTKRNICESCGMPIRRLSDFGTRKDGSIHTEYCNFCFKRGEFTDPGISMEEKIKKNIAIARKMGISPEEAEIMAFSTIPRLKRWRKTRAPLTPKAS
ncbi:MAG: zinc ribbon domain-containing protein [Eudoraea sp.]|nr:zinc ribbon domain-containing protein [Eudoraea sp.]